MVVIWSHNKPKDCSVILAFSGISSVVVTISAYISIVDNCLT